MLEEDCAQPYRVVITLVVVTQHRREPGRVATKLIHGRDDLAHV